DLGPGHQLEHGACYIPCHRIADADDEQHDAADHVDVHHHDHGHRAANDDEPHDTADHDVHVHHHAHDPRSDDHHQAVASVRRAVSLVPRRLSARADVHCPRPPPG